MRPLLLAASALLLAACQPGPDGGSTAVSADGAMRPVALRAPTQAEIDRHRRDCPWRDGRVVGRVSPVPGLTVPVRRLPAISVLGVADIVSNGGSRDSASIRAFDPLPDGGIAGIDLCETLTVLTFDRAAGRGDLVASNGLRLRPGLDIAGDYARVSPEIARRGQLRTVAAGCHAAFDLRQRDPKLFWDRFGDTWTGRQPGRLGLQRGPIGYIPVACP